MEPNTHVMKCALSSDVRMRADVDGAHARVRVKVKVTILLE